MRALAAFLAVFAGMQAQPLREAARLDAEGKCDAAERLYEAALASGPPSPALLNNAGNHYLICGPPDRAQALFERLVRINPGHQNANLQLARIAVERKQGKKAIEYLARVKEADPGAILLRAEALHWAGQAAASRAALAEAERAAGDDPRLLYLLGLACARMDLYGRAEEAFNRALAQNPDDLEILSSLGRAASRAEHYDRAQRALDAALKIRPGDVDVLVEFGKVCAARHDYVRAVFLLAQARQRAPGNTDILLLLARAAEDAGYNEDAASAYDDYLRLKPGDDAARRDRARACANTESRLEEARREITAYLAKHPGDPQGHYVAAQVLWWPEPEEALRHLSEAVRLDPNSASIRFSRAWMLQRTGRMAESLPDLEIARKLAPENARILDLLGLAHLALEQPAEAEKVLRQALAKAPGDPEVVLHLGRALMALGREEEAQGYMEQYQKLRPQRLPGIRKRPKMVELATLSAPEQRGREIERFRIEAREHPDRPDYQLHLSSLLLADGQRDEALREFRRLLDFNANAEVWEQAGTLLLSSGEPALAKEFLSRAPSARADLAIAVFQVDGPGPALQLLSAIPEAEMTGDLLLLRADILEAAGNKAEAEKMLGQALSRLSTRPAVVQRAVVLLLRHGRKTDALQLLERTIAANPQDSELPLARTVVLGLMDRLPAAEKAVKEIELRWPELDRAYLTHGLLLERAGRAAESRQKLRTAAALGSRCAQARLAGAPGPALEQLLYANCAR